MSTLQGARPALATVERGEIVRSCAVAAIWLALAHWLPQLAWRWVPRALISTWSLPAYSLVCQVLTASVGVALCVAFVPRPAEALGCAPAPLRDVALALLLAPAIFVASSRLALTLAEPMLLAELAAQGEGASRRNAGEFGRAITQAPMMLVVLWGVALAAVTEELLFRGVLVSALVGLGELILTRSGVVATHATRGWSVPEPNGPSGAVREILRERARRAAAGVAVVASAAVFAMMYADMAGSVGVVRVVSTACLGAVCGLARVLSRSVLTAMTLHLAYNSVSLGLGRSWFGPRGDTIIPAIPNPLLAIAVTGLLVSSALLVLTRARRPNTE